GRGRLLHERGEHLGLRSDEEPGDVVSGEGVDLLRAVLGQGLLGRLQTLADEDGGGLAEAAGDGEELSGGLADLAVRVVDENENCCHDYFTSFFTSRDRQMNLREARNSASLVPPSPSSATIVPCSRGGRLVISWTAVQAASRPTWEASTPRSA